MSSEDYASYKKQMRPEDASVPRAKNIAKLLKLWDDGIEENRKKWREEHANDLCKGMNAGRIAGLTEEEEDTSMRRETCEESEFGGELTTCAGGVDSGKCHCWKKDVVTGSKDDLKREYSTDADFFFEWFVCDTHEMNQVKCTCDVMLKGDKKKSSKEVTVKTKDRMLNGKVVEWLPEPGENVNEGEDVKDA